VRDLILIRLIISLIPAYGEVYSTQIYVITFCVISLSIPLSSLNGLFLYGECQMDNIHA
jgi:hypothetical protein